MKDIILAIDIGGSKYMVGLVDTQGKIIDSRHYKWKTLTTESVIECIIKSARKLLDKHIDISPVSIGITIPGLADPKHGIWIESSFSGIRNINIGQILKKEFGIPVYIDNDGQACALAEKLFGACKETSDFIYMTVSNGIGGAVFVNDMLYYGGYGNAGEIGHCVVVENGLQCKCGNKGCLEVHAAGPAIARNYIKLGGNEMYYGVPVDSKIIAELAYKGDDVAHKTFELEGYYVGKVIALICNVLNPQKVIIGGGVSLAFSLYEQALWKSIKRFLYRGANQNLKIQASQFGYNGGILGATAVAICGSDHKYNWGNINI
jgi:glucokinase